MYNYRLQCIFSRRNMYESVDWHINFAKPMNVTGIYEMH